MQPLIFYSKFKAKVLLLDDLFGCNPTIFI
ncbi:MAG: hypothetical protein H6Q19_1171 [Bacteroidetes bacterium]|nr:hypothetical protein [Bacteroidota bacterium]